MNIETRTRMVPHPIPYQGSKRELAPHILGFFPGVVSRLVEPFAGSAALSLAAAYNGLAESFWINDAHAPIVALWREILSRPDSLARRYATLWKSQIGRQREFYDQIRKRFNKTHNPTCFLYLLARCVKAAIRYNSDGQFNNSPDNRRLGAHPNKMKLRIVGAASLLAGHTDITDFDYREVLRRCAATDLIYMDPPYQGVCGNHDHRYAPKVRFEEFCAALFDLNQRGCRFIVSYDGRSGTKTYGKPLPRDLELLHLEVHAGRSTQATLLGRSSDTVESLYISPTLAARFGRAQNSNHHLQATFSYADRFCDKVRPAQRFFG